MVPSRPSGRGFPAAMVFLALTGLLALRSALPVPVPAAEPIAVVGRGPQALAGLLGLAARAAGSATTTTRPAPIVVRPAPGPVTGTFRERRPGHTHLGIDIDGETGDPVRAAAAGFVIASGSAPTGYSGYGTIVIVAHVDSLTTLYAHLSRVAVKAGQPVRAGDIVGAMGCTGSCTGSHLHFEVRLDTVPIDPERYLPRGSTA